MDLDTKRNQNREGLRALQKDLSLSGKSRLPHHSPGGLFSLLRRLCLVPNRDQAGGHRGDTPMELGEEMSQVSHRLWLRVSAAQLHDRPVGAGLSMLALGR